MTRTYLTVFRKINTLVILATLLFSISAYAGFCDDEDQTKFEKYSNVLSIEIPKSGAAEIYSACKIMPDDTSKAILAYSPPSSISDASEVESYDLVILIVDISNGKVLDKYIEKNVIKSDAISYQMLSIDTANYLLSPQQRAFGIRVSHRAGNNYSEDALNLYLQKDTKILKLLSGLVVNTSRSDINQTCDATYTDNASTLSMSKIKNNGFYNINVKTKETVSIETPPRNIKKGESSDCDRKEKVKTSNQQIIFTDKAYLVPKTLKASMFN
jgi:hypothetical protein